jgi:hypothetical protein
MNIKERLKEIEKESSCLELINDIDDIIDGFYNVPSGKLKRIDPKLESISGEIHCLYNLTRQLKNKLSKMDNGLGKGVI